MMIEKGDVAEVILTGRIKDGRVFQKMETPTPVIVGLGKLIKGLDEAILGMEVGERKTVEIPPEKGYGKRNPNLVMLVPMSSFKKSGIKPVPGTVVTIDGYPARVLSVSGGRVQVDFNHELAGKTLVFDIEVKAVYKKDEEKAKALAKKYFDSGIDVKANGEFQITAREEAFLSRDYLDKKVRLITELMALGKPVHWTEIYEPDTKEEKKG